MLLLSALLYQWCETFASFPISTTIFPPFNTSSWGILKPFTGLPFKVTDWMYLFSLDAPGASITSSVPGLRHPDKRRKELFRNTVPVSPVPISASNGEHLPN